jgi:hypothetical protein
MLTGQASITCAQPVILVMHATAVDPAAWRLACVDGAWVCWDFQNSAALLHRLLLRPATWADQVIVMHSACACIPVWYHV